MSERDDQIAQLRRQLDALAAVKTQEDFDEGARLHAEHNAPWVKGAYSHLKFPPYVFQAYPKMLYNEHYEAACKAYDEALMIPGRGMDDAGRALAIVRAERLKTQAVTIVGSAAEHDALGRDWYESPVDAVASVRARQEEIATLAAHRAYEDRNMGEGAQREIAAADEAAEDFLVAVPTKRAPGRPRKVDTTATAGPATSR